MNNKQIEKLISAVDRLSSIGYSQFMVDHGNAAVEGVSLTDGLFAIAGGLHEVAVAITDVPLDSVKLLHNHSIGVDIAGMDELSEAIREVGISPNVKDSNG